MYNHQDTYRLQSFDPHDLTRKIVIAKEVRCGSEVLVKWCTSQLLKAWLFRLCTYFYLRPMNDAKHIGDKTLELTVFFFKFVLHHHIDSDQTIYTVLPDFNRANSTQNFSHWQCDRCRCWSMSRYHCMEVTLHLIKVSVRNNKFTFRFVCDWNYMVSRIDSCIKSHYSLITLGLFSLFFVTMKLLCK